MKKLVGLLAACLVAHGGIIWQAFPPGGGEATAVSTSWGGIVDYTFDDALTVSMSAVTSFHVTTRTAEAPLTMSWVNGENIPWRDAFHNNWVEFSVYGSDGIVRSAPFYDVEGHNPERKASMFSAATSVPELSVMPMAILLAFGAIMYRAFRK